MKKLLFVLLLAVFAMPMNSVHAAPPLPPQLRYVDAQLNVFDRDLVQYQDAYYATNGAYMQALKSHSVPPEGANLPDGLYSYPSDQPVALAELWNYAGLPMETNWSFWVDTYSGPDGDGFVLNVETVIDGVLWQRSTNYGPPSNDWFFTSPWHVVLASPF